MTGHSSPYHSRPNSAGGSSASADTTNAETCPDCSGQIVIDDNDKICEECGLLIDDQPIDPGKEWREYGSEDKSKRRTGPALSIKVHDRGLSTNIDFRNKDGYGNQIGQKKRRQLNRLRRMDKHAKAKDSKERNLRFAFGELNRMCCALGISDSTENVAAKLYRECVSNDLLPGRSIEGMATGCLYIACKLTDAPRTLDEMTSVSRVCKNRIGRAHSYIKRELDLKIPPSDPKQYIPRFLSEIDEEISQETERLANRLVDHIKDNGLHSGKTPAAVAAGAIYFANVLCNEGIKQDDLAEITNVSTVSIRSNYMTIINHGDESWIHDPIILEEN